MVWTLQKQKILRRGGKNTQKNYTKKIFITQDNHDGVVTHLEPDILECEIKWALGTIVTNKTSRGDGIPVAAAAAKSLQSCLTLCDPIDGSPQGSPVPGILQARTLEWVAIAFSNA